MGAADGTAAQALGAGRRMDVQGLRAIAILLVVAYHAGFNVPGGFTGVDVFFAISGFVITGTLLRELSADGRIELGRFYLRRARRLLPGFAVMVAVIASLGVVASPAAAQRLGAVTGLFAAVFAANAYLYHVNQGYFDVGTRLDPFLHTWTLGVEEQFYVLFPGLLALSWWITRRSPRAAQRTAIAVTAIVALASVALAFRLSRGPVGGVTAVQRFAFYGSPTRAWEFGGGAIVALVAAKLERMPRWSCELASLAGLAAIGIGAALTQTTSHSPGKATLFPVLGTCVVIAAGTARQTFAGRLLGSKPFARVGDLSYSWYLWHWPLIVYAVALFPSTSHVALEAAALSIVPAWASFRYVEKPIREQRRWLQTRPGVALTATCIAVSALFSAGVLAAAHALSAASTVRNWQRAQTVHADVTYGCDSAAPFGGRPASARCTWSIPRAHGLVVLIGDSNAGHFTEPVTRAANEAGFNATVATFHGCPFADVRLVEGAVTETECRRFFAGSLAHLVRQHASLVIVAERTDAYVNTSTWELAAANGRDRTFSRDRKAQLLTRGLVAALRSLNEAAIPVVLVHPIPLVPVPSDGCAVLRILTNSCVGSVSRESAARYLQQAISIENAAVRATHRTITVNLENELCGRRECRSTRGGLLIYSDVDHLTVDGAMTLVPTFKAVIAANARRR